MRVVRPLACVLFRENTFLMPRSASTLFLALCCLLIPVLVGCETPEVSGQIPLDPPRQDTSPHRVHDMVLSGRPGEIVAVVFTSTDCPVANAMAPQLSRDLKRFESLGVRCYLVHPRRGVTIDQATRHRDDYGLQATVLLDPEHLLVEALDARITPEAFVIDFDATGDSRVRYRGRINDLYTSIGNRRDLATLHEWRDAVLGVMDGAEIDPNGPGAVGCMIQRH